MAPPCTEGAIWFVLKTPEESSEEEINGFAEFYPDVVRFTQLLNGPTVNENQ